MSIFLIALFLMLLNAIIHGVILALGIIIVGYFVKIILDIFIK